MLFFPESFEVELRFLLLFISCIVSSFPSICLKWTLTAQKQLSIILLEKYKTNEHPSFKKQCFVCFFCINLL